MKLLEKNNFLGHIFVRYYHSVLDIRYCYLLNIYGTKEKVFKKPEHNLNADFYHGNGNVPPEK